MSSMADQSVWDQFELGFWHPFGPYTGLSVPEIVRWKRDETERFGWTLWSFAYSPSAQIWQDALTAFDGAVFAFCSHSPAARDPDIHQGQLLATQYRYIGESVWRSMPDPDQMKVTNPFKRRGLALAFKVRRVVEIQPTIPPIQISWFLKRDRSWCSQPLPTRGEYLVRRGGACTLRRVSVLLELMPPYLTELRSADDSEER